MLKQESGQALPVVLLVLLLGVSFIVPAVLRANAVLIGQLKAKEALVDLYSADSATTYVMWKLWNVAGYSLSPPATENVTINGLTITVNIEKLLASNLVDQTIRSTINYNMAAGRQFWLTISTNDTKGGGVYIGYDTANTPSRVKIPWVSQGTKSYYFHNNPTPPTGNTNIPIIASDVCQSPSPCYDALRMDQTVPTATTLFNYDANRDVYQGRWIQQSNDGAQCASKLTESETVRIVWRSPTLTAADTINGEVEVRWWWAIEDASFGSHDLTMWFCDFDTANPVRDTGARNPVNIISGAGKLNTGKIPVWVDAFDLKATARSKEIKSRADKTASGMRMRSWGVDEAA